MFLSYITKIFLFFVKIVVVVDCRLLLVAGETETCLATILDVLPLLEEVLKYISKHFYTVQIRCLMVLFNYNLVQYWKCDWISSAGASEPSRMYYWKKWRQDQRTTTCKMIFPFVFVYLYIQNFNWNYFNNNLES